MADVKVSEELAKKFATEKDSRITSYNVCYTKLLRPFHMVSDTGADQGLALDPQHLGQGDIGLDDHP